MSNLQSSQNLLSVPALASNLKNLTSWTAAARNLREKFGLPNLERAMGKQARYIAATEGLAALPDYLLPEYAFIRVLWAKNDHEAKAARMWGLRSFSQALAYEAGKDGQDTFAEACQEEALDDAQSEAAEAANA